MAELVAMISIVSGATVAITVPFINSRLERSRLEKQSREARMEDLRGLLDGAAQHLYEAWTMLYEIEQEAQREVPRPEWSEKRLSQLGGEVTKEFDSIVKDGLRIGLRTPTGSGITEAHRTAQQLLARYELDYRRFLESELRDEERPPKTATTSEFARAIALFMDEIRAFVGVVEPTRTAPPPPPNGSPSQGGLVAPEGEARGA